MLKKLTIFFLALITICILALGVLTFNLDKILKPSLIGEYQKQFISELSIDWSKINIRVNNIGVFTKNITIESGQLCVDYKTSKFCHEKILFRVLVSPVSKSWFKVLDLKITGQTNTINLSDFKTKKITSWEPLHSQIYTFFKTLINNFRFTPQNFSFSSKGTVVDDKNKSFNYSLEVTPQDLKFNYNTSDLSLSIKNEEALNLSGTFENKFVFNLSNKSVKIRSVINSSLIEDGVLLNISVQAFIENSKDIELKTNLLLELDPKSLKATLSKLNTSYEPYLESVNLEKCTLKLTSSFGENINFECRKNAVVFSTDSFKKKWSRKNIADLGPFNFTFKVSLNEKVLFNLDKGKLGKASYKVDEKKGDFFTLKSNAALNFFKKENKMSLEPEVFNLYLDIFSYEKMVKKLAKSSFAIPAPFNGYKGTVSFITHDLKLSDKIVFPLQTVLKLKGGLDSEINLIGDGALDLISDVSGKYKPVLNLDVELGTNTLYLPDFDPLKGVPKLNSDPRIVYSNNKSSSAFLNTSVDKTKKHAGFKYNVYVKTKAGNPVKIKYNLLDPYLPLEFDAKINEKGVVLNLFSKRTWAVEYLKRRVLIKKMNLTKKTVFAQSYDVDALMLYKASEYDIYVTIVGNVESPSVKLRSDPPLSRSDIISVLLYNRTSNDIDRFQSESVGGAEAAFSDRALGLIGIWAFASTPIESVSYDSRSKTYRAQIALPGGVKFDIGTDWERVQNLSLRKRITKYWMVVTSYQPGIDDNEGVGDVLIQREWIF